MKLTTLKYKISVHQKNINMMDRARQKPLSKMLTLNLIIREH